MELKAIKNQIHLFKKAYKTLEKACEKKEWNDLEKDGSVQRFEYTIELAWKTCKKILEYEGIESNLFPKEIFKEFYKRGYIEDLEVWYKFLSMRNSMSHIYSEYVSEEIFDYILKNHHFIGTLIGMLEKWEEKSES